MQFLKLKLLLNYTNIFYKIGELFFNYMKFLKNCEYFLDDISIFFKWCEHLLNYMNKYLTYIIILLNT